MYHIVYLTTNLVNKKFYVGVHSTYDLNDKYLGSGDYLKSAINKYGKEQFNRQILYFAYDREQAYEIEKQIVDLAFIKRHDTYNMAIGGCTYHLLEHHNTCKKGSKFIELYGMEKFNTIRTKRRTTKIERGLIKNIEPKYKRTKEEIYNVLYTKERQEKISAKVKGMKYPEHMKENLSDYRKSVKFMYNENELITKHIKNEDVEVYLTLGWKLGKLPKRLKR